eukprot:m.102693 g.102693  ORF g.102693 m.102693 type:complete len:82 (-) comp15192_c0_seq2:971-1216(-)
MLIFQAVMAVQSYTSNSPPFYYLTLQILINGQPADLHINSVKTLINHALSSLHGEVGYTNAFVSCEFQYACSYPVEPVSPS